MGGCERPPFVGIRIHSVEDVDYGFPPPNQIRMRIRDSRKLFVWDVLDFLNVYIVLI